VQLDENRGIGNARAVAQVRCRSRLVTMLDADDVWLPDHVETLLATYRNSLGLVAAGVLRWGSGIGIGGVGEPPRHMPRRSRQRFEILKRSFLPISTLFSRSDLESAGGFRADADPEDWDLWIRMMREGVTAARTSHPTMLYRLHHASASFGDKLADAHVALLTRVVAEAVSKRERRIARHSLSRARAARELSRAYQAAIAGDSAAARRHAWQARRGGRRVLGRAAFMLLAPRRGATIHQRRTADLTGWVDA
jgi:glycosyltransferase involved in cell wall biosynthesis